MNLELVKHLIQSKESYKKTIEKELANVNESIAKFQRLKWWLEHPEVAYFTARTSWETNYGHSEWESELSFYVESVIGLDGLEIYDICFSGFPTLEEDILDDERFTTYRNPFLCT